MSAVAALVAARSWPQPTRTFATSTTANLVAFRGLWLFLPDNTRYEEAGPFCGSTEGAVLPPQLHGQHHRNEVADAAIPDLD